MISSSIRKHKKFLYKSTGHTPNGTSVNMKAISVLVLACVCLASGAYFSKDVKYADKDFLFKQKSILELLQHVHQNEFFSKYYEESQKFNFDSFKDHFVHPEVVQEYMDIYKYSSLPMNEVFTVMESEHLSEAKALFYMMYYAKDFDTYYKVLKWARFHVNEGIFIYALTASVLHRKDMTGIVLPAPYEIYPYYFFNNEVIQKAQHYRMNGFHGFKYTDEGYSVVIPANYTGSYVHTNRDQKMSYFTEDIGFNAFYYYMHMDYPFWLGGEEFGLNKDRRGEFYFYVYQQILARYHLERLSNGLGNINELSFYNPITTGYYPALRYYNGGFFPSRDNTYVAYHEENYEEVRLVEDYETRLRKAVDSGLILMEDGTYFDMKSPEGIEYFGNLVNSNFDSKNNRFYGEYEMYMRYILGGSVERVESNFYLPSTLEHYETSLRDPAFYQMYNRVLQLYYKYKEHLPAYEHKELAFDGVKIEGVEIDKLTTFFSKFDADITNAVDFETYDTPATPMQKFGYVSHYNNHDVFIKARQSRLNHLPFTMKLHVASEKAQKAVVKIFIGPKYDVHGHMFTLEENAQNFYELDHFFVDLVAGKNDIVRRSEDFSWFVKDRTTYYELYKQVMLAYNDQGKFPLDMSEAHCGIPMRLMLPKGHYGGMPFQFFFMVMPYHEPKVARFTGYDHTISCGVGSGARYLDNYAFGYPFDRLIDRTNWYTPNMHFHDVYIFHKRDYEDNTTH